MARTTIMLDDFVFLKARQASGGNLSKFIETLLRREVMHESKSMYGAFSNTKISQDGLRDKTDRVDGW